MRRFLFVCAALAALIVILMFPLSWLASPEWVVTVVDENKRPVPGALVREDFQNYSVEAEGHERDLTTDGQGKVTFPSVRMGVSIPLYVLGLLRSAMGGVHASFGPTATIDVFKGNLSGSPEKDGHIYFWKGSPARLETTIVLNSLGAEHR